MTTKQAVKRRCPDCGDIGIKVDSGDCRMFQFQKDRFSVCGVKGGGAFIHDKGRAPGDPGFVEVADNG